MRFNKSLSFKISFSILLAVLLIFTAIFLYNYIISSDLLMKNVKSNVMNMADRKALRIEKVLEVSASIPKNLSYFLESGSYTEKDLEVFVQQIVDGNEEVFGSCIAFEPYAYNSDSLYYAPYSFKADGGIVFKYLNSPAIDYFNQDWYRIPKEMMKPVWTEPYFDEGGGDILMCTHSVPFFYQNNSKKIRGIITIDISLEWLKEFVEDIKVYENGYAFLISSTGNVITHPLEDQIGQENVFDIASEKGYDILLRAAEAMVRGESDFIPYESPMIDGKTWLYYTPLKSSGWSLAVIIPEREFMADLFILNRDLLIIAVLGFVILLLIIIIISKRITNPLRMLSIAAQEIGHGDFNAKLPGISTSDEIGRLNASIGSMQFELKNYINDLKETTAAKEKIESELQIARDIQQGIIPKLFPAFPNIDSIDLFAVLDPARDVGGDLYDFFFVDEKHLCITIGDVSGKGVPASLFMAITRTLLRAKMNKNTSVEAVIREMNNELCLDNANAMFVTLFLGIIDIETGQLLYCNAGHNYPLLANSNGGVVELQGTHGTPLGAMPDLDYGRSEHMLKDGDLLVLYTDGIPEAIDLKEIQYSEERLIKTLESEYNESPTNITKSVLKDLHNFVGEAEQFDDITMLAVRWFQLDQKNNGN